MIMVGLVVCVVWLVLVPLGSGDTPKNRKIAAELLEYHRRWQTDPLLLQHLTNLPSPQLIESGLTGTRSISIHRNYTHLYEYYWIENSTTNLSEWTLYHAWYWDNHRIVGHKLLTIVEFPTGGVEGN